MIKIGVCDDDIKQIEILTSYLKKLEVDNLSVCTSNNCLTFLEKMDDFNPHIVFLDIEMKEMNGIELGKKMRKKFEDIIIVYVTGYKDYALNAFEIKAFNYILKPLTLDSFKRNMNDILDRYKEIKFLQERNKVHTIIRKDKVIKLNYDDIYYFEKSLRKIKVYTKNDNIEYYGTFKDLIEELDMEKGFIQTHQGYIVNRSKILEMSKSDIYLRDIDSWVSVSRTYKSSVRQALEDNLF